MQTIFVPTDFSETAKNAGRFAIQLAVQLDCRKIILYNAYQPPPVSDANLTVVMDVVSVEELEKISKYNLEIFKNDLISFAKTDLQFETISDFGMLTANINEVCKEKNVDLIVMGVTGGGKLEESLIGSFAVDVAAESTFPVIIVPPGAEFSGFGRIMLACDFSKLEASNIPSTIYDFLAETQAHLILVDIAEKRESAYVKPAYFDKYDPEYVSISDNDFVESINRTALEKKVDFIITIPKRMGWFEGLFKQNHTKQLAFHSHVPLMVLHG